MKKIPTLFVRDFEGSPPGRYVTEEVSPGCEWVLAGEGRATRKYDGTCVMIDNQGDAWARREIKEGKAPPARWVEVDHDETTGKRIGYEPAEQSSFARFIAQALELGPPPSGTYELCGPKVNGNPEDLAEHVLISHESAHHYSAMDHPQGYDELRSALTAMSWEGIVWHHPDGRMAKLKKRDFRLSGDQG